MVCRLDDEAPFNMSYEDGRNEIYSFFPPQDRFEGQSPKSTVFSSPAAILTPSSTQDSPSDLEVSGDLFSQTLSQFHTSGERTHLLYTAGLASSLALASPTRSLLMSSDSPDDTSPLHVPDWGNAAQADVGPFTSQSWAVTPSYTASADHTATYLTSYNFVHPDDQHGWPASVPPSNDYTHAQLQSSQPTVPLAQCPSDFSIYPEHELTYTQLYPPAGPNMLETSDSHHRTQLPWSVYNTREPRSSRQSPQAPSGPRSWELAHQAQANTSYVARQPPGRVGQLVLRPQNSMRSQSSNGAESATSPNTSNSVRSASPQRRRGGRRPGHKLEPIARQRANLMRRINACWRCALTRDQCDGGDPCSRCATRSQRAQTRLLDCDRRHLKDLVSDFLPTSMTIMHQWTQVDEFATDSVAHWYREGHIGIKVRLTCGCGPPIDWMQLYEYQPKKAECLGQIQYITNASGANVCVTKQSPPLGVLRLDQSDVDKFEAYLDSLIETALDHFVIKCFESEMQNDFQTELLRLIRTLYVEIPMDGNVDLKADLHSLFRMLIVTFIMAHTLTIERQSLDRVISQLHQRLPMHKYAEKTSPRLANVQLKYFFSTLRQGMFDKILKRFHAILRNAGPKNKTWITAFCILLFFAMALEECQHTINIQADARFRLGRQTQNDADHQARRDCKKIDETFEFLINLFHCKFRKRNRSSARLVDYQDSLNHESAEWSFVQNLKLLAHQHVNLLRYRKDLPVTPQNRPYHTSRLVAKALFEFMDLDTRSR